MANRRVAVVLLAATAAVVVPLAAVRAGGAPAEVGRAAPSTPAPTVPCEGCGPTPGTHVGKPFVFAYPLHFCPPGDTIQPAGAAVYSIVYGVGAQLGQTVTFYGQVPGKPLRTLQTLAPGANATEYPAAIVPFGVQGELTLWATPAGTGPNGPRVPWGNGGTSRTDILICDCAQPAATTTVPGPAVSVSTVPGQPTTTFALPPSA